MRRTNYPPPFLSVPLFLILRNGSDGLVEGGDGFGNGFGCGFGLGFGLGSAIIAPEFDANRFCVNIELAVLFRCA